MIKLHWCLIKYKIYTNHLQFELGKSCLPYFNTTDKERLYVIRFTAGHDTEQL